MGMLKDLDITPEDPAELKAVNRLLANEVKALSLKVEQLQHQLHGANRHRFGSKSEGLDQLRLDLQEGRRDRPGGRGAGQPAIPDKGCREVEAPAQPQAFAGSSGSGRRRTVAWR
jgi:hypothetical protein